jgi:SAM-dependent methyltransferase
MEAFCKVLVLDDHAEAVQLLGKRFSREQILLLTDGAVPLPAASLEYVTALDVLEHISNDRVVVEGFRHLLKPGGLAVVTVPASMALWSDWDVALHHFRRYRRNELRALFPANEWEIVHVNYTNTLVYPLVWLARRWRKWFPAKQTAVRAEDRLPAGWINWLLRTQFTWLARSRVPMPFGVSLVLIARRR